MAYWGGKIDSQTRKADAMLRKSYMSADQQIGLLTIRGMTFPSEKTARAALDREGYYNIISGYKDPFVEADTQYDVFRAGTTFDHVYELFLIDRDLRALLFQATEQAEAFLRTTCIRCFSRAHPQEKNAYLELDHYANPRDAHSLLGRFLSILRHNEPGIASTRDTQPCISVPIQKYDGEVPLWNLARALTLGQLTTFYRVLSVQQRSDIAQEMTRIAKSSASCELTPEQLDSLYHHILTYRNLCAHHRRLYCAYPQYAQISLFDMIQQLQLVIRKSDYLEFLMKVWTLLRRIYTKLPPDAAAYVLEALGLGPDVKGGMTSYERWVDMARKA
ncbi:Abi family protein [Alloscardovia macacae]|nr:Abi family protein [Alloscardovia macacae]